MCYTTSINSIGGRKIFIWGKDKPELAVLERVKQTSDRIKTSIVKDNPFLSSTKLLPGIKIKQPLQADTISFGSINNPTAREKQGLKEIDKLIAAKDIEKIRSKCNDASTLVRVKAYEALLKLLPLKHEPEEKKKLQKAHKMAMDTIKQYDNGNDIDRAIEDMQNNGFVVLMGEDYLPPDLCKDEEFLTAWNFDEDEIDEQIQTGRPLLVKEVLKKAGSAEIHYKRKGLAALVLFHDENPRKDAFWHEWFHYCQHISGLKSGTKSYKENAGSSFAKRELETYQFILNNRELLKLKPAEVKLNIAVWNSYKDLYKHERGEKIEEE